MDTKANNNKNNQLILDFKNVSRLYSGEGQSSDSVAAVDHVTFQLFAGDFTALVGPSGSGKSTLLNLASSNPADCTGLSAGQFAYERKLAAVQFEVSSNEPVFGSSTDGSNKKVIMVWALCKELKPHSCE